METIQKITTKLSIISTYIFFSVLPTKDTDSVSERHYKFVSHNSSYDNRPYTSTYHILHNNKKIAMDDNKPYL